MKRSFIEYMAWGCVIIGGIFFLVYIGKLLNSDYSIIGVIGDKDIERTAQIGDFFGGVIGSFWALAGVLLYFSALKMQSKELSNQIYEINETKKNMSQQQFETTFFTLLNTQQNIKNNIKGYFFSVETDGKSYQEIIKSFSSCDYFSRAMDETKQIYTIYKRTKYRGWDADFANDELSKYNQYVENSYNPILDYGKKVAALCCSSNLDYLTSHYKIDNNDVKYAHSYTTEEVICQCVYLHLYIDHHNELGHYCRHLYNIIKFIDREQKEFLREIDIKFPIDNREKKIEQDKIKAKFDDYVAFVHSILSTAELFILFYNALIFPKAKKLYVEYRLFDNLLQENLLDEKHAELMKGATLKTSRDLFDSIIKDKQST